jgi:hypothetical protein
MRRTISGLLFLCGAAAVVAAALLAQSRGWIPAREDTDRSLMQPLRVGVASTQAYDQLLAGLRAHHYRPKPQGEARFRDVLYDTPRWDLSRHGYSYRLRTRLEGSGDWKYSLRLEQEPRVVPANAARLEVAAEVPDALGAAIEAGAWERGVLEPGVEPAERLRSLLHELGLEPAALAPRLVAELARERLDVSDKGQDWFELQREAWTFRPIDAARDSTVAAFEDVLIETRVGEQDPELYRRVRTLQQLVRMLDGITPLEKAPHERAIEALGPPL